MPVQPDLSRSRQIVTRRVCTAAWVMAGLSGIAQAARTQHITLTAPHGIATAAAVDPVRGFVYFATTAEPFPYTIPEAGAHVLRVRLSDFVLAGSMNLPPGENPVSTLLIDPSGQNAYLGLYGDPHKDVPGRLVRINLSRFKRESSVTLDSGLYGLQAGAIAPSGKAAYFGTLFGAVTGVSLPDIQPLGTLALQREVNAFRCGVIDPSGRFGYFGTGSGVIMQVDLTNWLPAGSLAVLRGDSGFSAASRDREGQWLYLATDETPSRLFRISIVDMKVDGTMQLAATEGPAVALYIDDLSHSLFLVYGGDTPGVVKINSRTLTRHQHQPLPKSLGAITCTAFDRRRRRVFLGMGTSPARIVQIDLQHD